MKPQTNAVEQTHPEQTYILLPLLWVFLSLNNILCDLLSNMEAPTLLGLLEGSVAGFPVTQGFLLFAGITLEIPILMILLSAVLPLKTNKVVSVCAAGLMIAYQIGSLMVGSGITLHYAFFSAVEIIANAAVIVLAARRKR